MKTSTGMHNHPNNIGSASFAMLSMIPVKCASMIMKYYTHVKSTDIMI